MMQFWKKRLGRSLALAGLAALCTLALVANAQADSYVGSAIIETSTGGATTVGTCCAAASNGGINNISGDASNGFQYVNNTTSNIFGTAGDIRVVGANLLSNYIAYNNDTFTALYNGTPIVAVFALEGNTSGPSATLFTATAGRLGFFSIAGGFNRSNPLTWGATDSLGTTLLTPIAVWDLKPAEPVHDSPSDPRDPTFGAGGTGVFNLATFQVNQISVNALVGSANQGYFLFLETQTFSGATLEGNNFVTVVSNPFYPSILPIADEGLVSSIQEHILTANANNTNAVNPGAGGTAGFNALNTIAGQLGGLPNLTGAGTAFACGFGGLGSTAAPGCNFNPSTAANNLPPNTNDLLLDLGSQSSPTAQPIPEPATISLFICGGLAACGMSLVRRFRGKRTKVG